MKSTLKTAAFVVGAILFLGLPVASSAQHKNTRNSRGQLAFADGRKSGDSRTVQKKKNKAKPAAPSSKAKRETRRPAPDDPRPSGGIVPTKGDFRSQQPTQKTPFVKYGRQPNTRPMAAHDKKPIKVAPTVTHGGKTFSQKVVVHNNKTLVERRHHHDHSHYYHHHHWGHHYYYCYVHYWAYDPWFWGWYWAPFPAPWHYTWFWVGAPWYGAWGWYWSPYPYYVGPSYWVTDYVVSDMLADEYARGYQAGRQDAEGAPITEPVKEQLRVQVEETSKSYQTDEPLMLENALKQTNYLFVVDTPITVMTETGATCSLTGGDIIKLAGGYDPNGSAATMVVVTSKRENCAAGSQVTVSYTDLQEMLNTFGATVDDGMNELQKKQAAEQAGTGE